MKLTVDSNDRIFFVKCRFNEGANPVVCNLQDIPKVVESFKPRGVEYIKEIWDGKLHRVSKKNLKEMFEAHKIEQNFL